MKRIYLLISLLTSILLLFACGGGGGGGDDSTPTDPSTVFSLAKYNSLDEGTKFSFFLTGTDNTGQSWNSSINLTIEPIVNIGGVDYIPEEALVSLTYVPSNITETDTINKYYTLAGDPVYYIHQFSGTRCDAVTVNLLPDNVLIGQTGDTTSYTCDNSTQIRGAWSVEDAYDGYAFLVITEDTWELSGWISYTETQKYKIDSVGTIHSLTMIAEFLDLGLTLNLSSE